MGKVTIIKKSRKECTCNKCGKVIPVGNQYYRGKLNFHPDIIRCNHCKLENWEVTTSDYQLQVGAIVYEYYNTYGSGEGAPEEIASELESIASELQDRLDNMPEGLQDSDTGMLLQDRLDNMPEGLQDSDTGMLLQERIEQLEEAQSNLECIDIDNLKQEVVDEYNSSLEEEKDEVEELDWDNPEQYSEILDIVESLENKISEAIEESLSVIEI